MGPGRCGAGKVQNFSTMFVPTLTRAAFGQRSMDVDAGWWMPVMMIESDGDDADACAAWGNQDGDAYHSVDAGASTKITWRCCYMRLRLEGTLYLKRKFIVLLHTTNISSTTTTSTIYYSRERRIHEPLSPEWTCARISHRSKNKPWKHSSFLWWHHLPTQFPWGNVYFLVQHVVHSVQYSVWYAV